MKMARNVPIDILKGLAILSVILLHTWDRSVLLKIGAPYYISQAVPIFIIIAAYNGVNSYIRENNKSLTQCYISIPRRLKRLILPYCVIFIIEYIYIIFINLFIENNGNMIEAITGRSSEQIQAYIHSAYSIPHAFSFIVTGGYGPGSFFIPVLVPLILALPILYSLARRSLLLMLIVTFIIDLAFEIYAFKSGMPDWIYRLLFIRYLFAFGLGIWLAFGVDRKWLAVSSIISIIYITAIDYYDYMPLAQPSWGSQNALSFVWPLALIVMWISVSAKDIDNHYARRISEIGKASYHIFLIQMVYFWAIGGFINSSTHSAFIINIIVCVSFGLMFNYLSKIITSKSKELGNKV